MRERALRGLHRSDPRDLGAAATFAAFVALGMLGWSWSASRTRVLSDGTSAGVAAGWQGLLVLAALVLASALLHVAGFHRSAGSAAGAALLGAGIALIWGGAWAYAASVPSILVPLACVPNALGLVVLGITAVVRARERDDVARRKLFRRALGLAVLATFVLDVSTLPVLFLSGQVLWGSYISAALLGAALLNELAPRGAAHRSEVVRVLAAFLAWMLLLPFVPWHATKTLGFDLVRAAGRPAEGVREVLGRYVVDVDLPDGRQVTGRFRDFEPAVLASQSQLFLWPGAGGCALAVDGTLRVRWIVED